MLFLSQLYDYSESMKNSVHRWHFDYFYFLLEYFTDTGEQVIKHCIKKLQIFGKRSQCKTIVY